jgi:DNA polymerase V
LKAASDLIYQGAAPLPRVNSDAVSCVAHLLEAIEESGFFRGDCDSWINTVRADLLSTVPVDEVWGIGAASATKLLKIGVKTAADLAALDPNDARALMTVTGGRTVHELRGISCLPLELMEPTRKGIAVTRSFGAPVTSWREMR